MGRGVEYIFLILHQINEIDVKHRIAGCNDCR